MHVGGNMMCWFALSSAIGSHLLSRSHLQAEESWYENKWFWAGLFGNLPALVAFIAHIVLTRRGEEKDAAE